jgi:hypothetical protein
MLFNQSINHLKESVDVIITIKLKIRFDSLPQAQSRRKISQDDDSDSSKNLIPVLQIVALPTDQIQFLKEGQPVSMCLAMKLPAQFERMGRARISQGQDLGGG